MKHFLLIHLLNLLLPAANGLQDTAQTIQPFDILISEILSNPKPGGAEFIEIYNPTNHAINLQNLQIARIYEDSLGIAHPITTHEIWISPRAYKVITKDPTAVQLQYYTPDPSAFISLSTMPLLPNQEGAIALLSNHEIVDRLHYSEHMHNPFIKDAKGVSLERISFEITSFTANNFTSAAAQVGYATPGYQNSQQGIPADQQEAIWLNSKTFSPDQDGFEDLLQLQYRFKRTGNIANIIIYNDHGQAVKHLLKQALLATSGTILWNGLDDSEQRLPIGIYVIHVELYNTIDGVKKYRKNCVLAGKF